LGFAGFIVSQKQSIESDNAYLESELERSQVREKESLGKVKGLNKEIADIKAAKAKLQKKLSKFEKINIEELSGRVGKLSKRIEVLTTKKDDFKAQVERIKKERNDLRNKLAKKPKEKIVYKHVKKTPGEKGEILEEGLKGALSKEAPGVPAGVDEDVYWGKVLKRKIGLELEVESVKQDLTKSSLEIVELKKKNSDLQLELSEITNKRESIERQIKYSNDLSDSLSLELARAKNDNKFLNDRIAKLSGQNLNFHQQIKQLTSTKIALEKSIVRLQEEKKDVEKKLLQTENIIQRRIDDIWDIKDNLEKEFKPVETSATGEIELPPIVVSAVANEPPAANSGIAQAPAGSQAVGYNGNIVSVND
jgi:chromosome segregation ATPase